MSSRPANAVVVVGEGAATGGEGAARDQPRARLAQ
jgi:hypothetical protein